MNKNVQHIVWFNDLKIGMYWVVWPVCTVPRDQCMNQVRSIRWWRKLGHHSRLALRRVCRQSKLACSGILLRIMLVTDEACCIATNEASVWSSIYRSELGLEYWSRPVFQTLVWLCCLFNHRSALSPTTSNKLNGK